MESTNSSTQTEQLQEFKEQLIQRSKQADSPEESNFYLCQADLYTLAIQHENANMYGSTLSIQVGSDDDAVNRVSVEVHHDFKSNTNYFTVSFGMWKALTSKVARGVSEKRFSSAEEAYDFITGLAESINRFFNSIQL